MIAARSRGWRRSWGRRGSAVVVVVAATVAVVPTAGEARDHQDRLRAGRPISGAHDCVPRRVDDRGDARVAWSVLRNPVFALGHMTKDQAIRLTGGRWYLVFSERPEESGSAPTGHWTSIDLAEWMPAPAAAMWGSPDLTARANGDLVVTFQRADPATPDRHRLFFATAPSAEGPWSEPQPLAPDLFPDERLIDAALAHTKGGLILAFKRGARDGVQRVEIASSPSGALDGPWEHVGNPDLPLAENFQFLPIDGVWHVLVTTIPQHVPTLYRLVGDPGRPRGWLRWKMVRPFEVPEEAWNTGRARGVTHEVANAAFLCDDHAHAVLPRPAR